MKKLKIAQLAPLWVPVPPKKYGGIERVAHYLTEELVKRGHEVTLFASGDSKTSAKLVAVYPRHLLQDKVRWTNPLWNLENLTAAFKQAEEFDIIHSHLDVWPLFFQEFIKTPVLHTFHNPLHKQKKIFNKRRVKKIDHRLQIFNLYRKSTLACFISGSQKKLCPINFTRNWIAYNGIDTSLYEFNERPEDHFIWIARIDPYKGIENAIAAAEKADVKLLLAGRLDADKAEYFEEKIRPRLSKRIQYIGELSQKELSNFYGKAKALLYPIEWEEPFGLVMVEAMACGTPVIAFKKGSVPEVVKHGKTGFVIAKKDKKGKRNIAGLVKAIKKIDEIKRKDCRQRVEENFSFPKMVDRYEEIYYQILKIK